MSLGARSPGFLRLVSGRLIRRSSAAPRWARIVTGLGLAALALVGLALALGWRGPLVIAGLWLASLAVMIAVLVTKLRAMLVVAVLGLALGVASLFVVLGVASGTEAVLVASLAQLNGHAMISKYGLDFHEYEAVATTLEADPRVRAASPFVFGVGAIVSDERPAHERSPTIVSIKGVDPVRLAGFSGAAELLAVGELDSLRPAGPRTRPGAVLGTRLARRIGAQLGDVVRVVVPASIRPQDAASARAGQPVASQPPRHGEFEVLGLLDTGFAEFDASFVLVHITAAQALVYGQRRASGVELELVDARLGHSLTVAKELVAGLDRERTAAGRPPLYRATSWAERSETLMFIRQTKTILVVVLSLIIVVASGTLLGALLVMVRRERRHIGVLAALGARPAQLFWVFELVGIGIAVLGSALGVAWGSVSLLGLQLLELELDPTIYMIDRLPAAFVIGDLLVPSLIAVAVCALVSGPVALRVSRTRPIELVRG